MWTRWDFCSFQERAHQAGEGSVGTGKGEAGGEEIGAELSKPYTLVPSSQNNFYKMLRTKEKLMCFTSINSIYTA